MLESVTLSQTETDWLRTTASGKWLRTCVSTRGMEGRVRPSVVENKKTGPTSDHGMEAATARVRGGNATERAKPDPISRLYL